MTISRMEQNAERWTSARHQGQVVFNLRRANPPTGQHSASKPRPSVFIFFCTLEKESSSNSAQISDFRTFSTKYLEASFRRLKIPAVVFAGQRSPPGGIPSNSKSSRRDSFLALHHTFHHKWGVAPPVSAIRMEQMSRSHVFTG